MAANEKQDAGENLSFEEAIAKLESIVKSLDDGSVPLDKSLANYEEGIKLIRRCNYLLDNAEKRVKILTRDESGEVAEADFEAK